METLFLLKSQAHVDLIKTFQRKRQAYISVHGDKVPHDAWDERFEHPARTWASASHRAFTLQATGVAMANAT